MSFQVAFENWTQFHVDVSATFTAASIGATDVLTSTAANDDGDEREAVAKTALTRGSVQSAVPFSFINLSPIPIRTSTSTSASPQAAASTSASEIAFDTDTDANVDAGATADADADADGDVKKPQPAPPVLSVPSSVSSIPKSIQRQIPLTLSSTPSITFEVVLPKTLLPSVLRFSHSFSSSYQQKQFQLRYSDGRKLKYSATGETEKISTVVAVVADVSVTSVPLTCVARGPFSLGSALNGLEGLSLGSNPPQAFMSLRLRSTQGLHNCSSRPIEVLDLSGTASVIHSSVDNAVSTEASAGETRTKFRVASNSLHWFPLTLNEEDKHFAQVRSIRVRPTSTASTNTSSGAELEKMSLASSSSSSASPASVSSPVLAVTSAFDIRTISAGPLYSSSSPVDQESDFDWSAPLHLRSRAPLFITCLKKKSNDSNHVRTSTKTQTQDNFGQSQYIADRFCCVGQPHQIVPTAIISQQHGDGVVSSQTAVLDPPCCSNTTNSSIADNNKSSSLAGSVSSDLLFCLRPPLLLSFTSPTSSNFTSNALFLRLEELTGSGPLLLFDAPPSSSSGHAIPITSLSLLFPLSFAFSIHHFPSPKSNKLFHSTEPLIVLPRSLKKGQKQEWEVRMTRSTDNAKEAKEEVEMWIVRLQMERRDDAGSLRATVTCEEC